MQAKRIWVTISVLLALGLLIIGFGCTETTPTSSPSPTTTGATTKITPSPSPAQPQVIKWRGQIATVGRPMGHFDATGPGIAQVRWANWIKEASKGRLEIELVTAGTLIPQNEVVDGVGKGVMQFARNYGTWSSGVLPESNIEVGMPFIAETVDEAWDWIYNTGINELFVQAYGEHNVFPVIYGNGQISHIGAKFPMNTPETIKGKKMRGMGVMEDYVKLLGGAPVTIAWNDVYMALKLGTIDGYVGGLSGLEDIKLKEVLTHYVINPNLSTTIQSMVFNRDALKALPEDLQVLITRDTKYVLSAAAHDMNMAERFQMAQMKNITFQSWSAEDIEKIRQQAIITIWPKLAQPNARCAKIMEITQAWAKEYGKLK